MKRFPSRPRLASRMTPVSTARVFSALLVLAAVCRAGEITGVVLDGQGRPVPAVRVQLLWSSQWMDGGMASDEDGIVRLAGGGVAIGGPPYRLRVQSLKGKERTYQGQLRKVRRGIAIVELRPLQVVTGTVKRGDAAVERYVLFVVGPGATPRVYTARVEDGTFAVHLPDGTCRFVIGTADGRTQEHELEVKAGSATTHEIVLK